LGGDVGGLDVERGDLVDAEFGVCGVIGETGEVTDATVAHGTGAVGTIDEDEEVIAVGANEGLNPFGVDVESGRDGLTFIGSGGTGLNVAALAVDDVDGCGVEVEVVVG
jgi:hypothetical protein